MKLIIAGSRALAPTPAFILDAALMLTGCAADVTEIVSGGAWGVDHAGEAFAREHAIPVILFPADWDKNGKAAGPIRNRFMAEYADALLLIWDGESRGSANMKAEMLKLGKPVYEVILRRVKK